MIKFGWVVLALFLAVPALTFLMNGCQSRNVLLQVPGSTNMIKSSEVSVELFVFSGRPNPSWPLSDTQAKELWALVDKLSVASNGLTPDQLGYSGFLVKATDLPSNISMLKVFRGIVEVTTKNQVLYRQDPSREIEHWLLKTAATQVDAELYDFVAAEINKD